MNVWKCNQSDKNAFQLMSQRFHDLLVNSFLREVYLDGTQYIKIFVSYRVKRRKWKNVMSFVKIERGWKIKKGGWLLNITESTGEPRDSQGVLF